MPYRRKTTTRPKRRVYRRRGAGRAGYRKRSAALHGVKKFTCMMKVSDVIAPANALLPDGIRVYNLKFKYDDLPISTQITALFRQVALTGVKVMYKTTNPTPTIVQSAGADEGSEYAHPSVNMYYVEDKDTETDLTVSQFKSQDNTKRLVSHKNFSHYVRNPRPAIYQMDGASHLIKTIDSSNQIHWISTNATYGRQLLHLNSQLAVEELPDDVPLDTGGQKQGEIWLKVYLIAKEQNV